MCFLKTWVELHRWKVVFRIDVFCQKKNKFKFRSMGIEKKILNFPIKYKFISNVINMLKKKRIDNQRHWKKAWDNSDFTTLILSLYTRHSLSKLSNPGNCNTLNKICWLQHLKDWFHYNTSELFSGLPKINTMWIWLFPTFTSIIIIVYLLFFYRKLSLSWVPLKYSCTFEDRSGILRRKKKNTVYVQFTYPIKI